MVLLQFINIFDNYKVIECDKYFIESNYKLLHDSSEDKSNVFKIEFEFKCPELNIRNHFESITKVYESKYDFYIISYHNYVVSKSKLSKYRISKKDMSDIIFKGK